MIDGDEALVGMQAERILQGHFPVYFYGIPYFGSLEAYLASILFAIFGPSPWALRAEATRPCRRQRVDSGPGETVSRIASGGRPSAALA